MVPEEGPPSVAGDEEVDIDECNENKNLSKEYRRHDEKQKLPDRPKKEQPPQFAGASTKKSGVRPEAKVADKTTSAVRNGLLFVSGDNL